MICLACNKILSDREASRKSSNTGEHIDLCDECFEPIRKEVFSEWNHSLKDQEFEETIYTPLHNNSLVRNEKED